MLDFWLDFSQLKTYILSTSVTDDRIVPPTLSSLWFFGWDLGCWVCFGYFDLLVCFWHCHPPCRGLFEVEKKVNSHLWSRNPSLSTFKQISSHKCSYVHLQHGEAEAKEVSITFPRPSPVNWTQLMGCQCFISGTFVVAGQGCLMNETSTGSVSAVDLISKCSKSWVE